MDATNLVSSLLMAVADRPALLVLAIVAATFVLEDIATVAVALLASHMLIDTVTAVVALTVGTALGDLALYVLAARAGDARWVRAGLNTSVARSVLGWFGRYSIPIVTIARFIPGTRLPVYLAAGSVRMPFGMFTLLVVGTAIVWTPALFLTAGRLGEASIMGSGAFGWAGLGLAGALLLLAPRAARAFAGRRASVA